jgi:fibronectin type 3 domain-containing protein
VFDKWVVNSGNPSIADVTAASTIVTMPSSNATVTATYKDIIIDVTPTDITNLAATALTCNSVKLTWGDVEGEDAYRIRRKTPNGTYEILADVPANTITYTDNTAAENTSYVYMVRPMQNGAAVKISNEALVATPACADTQAPTAPTGVTSSASYANISLRYRGQLLPIIKE